MSTKKTVKVVLLLDLRFDSGFLVITRLIIRKIFLWEKVVYLIFGIFCANIIENAHKEMCVE